ncbi:hypothetical protein Ahy_B05g078577 [Arachis hypogaea]|uniref:Uncharacterized protein n=1 Tax=Arachis hypogaea TaxID=3818 RepID=A0A444Z7F2_ARAHY|nr:hypothetical protein Ahy_B05g078577 [Arachis hypogaea]
MVGTLTLADMCREKGLTLINYATGMILSTPWDLALALKDTPNIIESFYSKTKPMVEICCRNYENVCTLRVGKFLTQVTRESVLAND